VTLAVEGLESLWNNQSIKNGKTWNNNDHVKWCRRDCRSDLAPEDINQENTKEVSFMSFWPVQWERRVGMKYQTQESHCTSWLRCVVRCAPVVVVWSSSGLGAWVNFAHDLHFSKL
jgi:hypothetical protein